MSLTSEESKVIMDEITEEVRAELDASGRTDLNIYDDSNEADEEMDRRPRGWSKTYAAKGTYLSPCSIEEHGNLTLNMNIKNVGLKILIN